MFELFRNLKLKLMSKLSLKPILLLLTLSLLSLLFLSINFESNNFNSNSDYNVYALSIPEKMEFCGEYLPLSKPDVKERIDKELLVNTYWQSNGFLLFKRSNKYFPVIEPILESYGVPNDFKYLSIIESGLQNVTSSAGAKGFWQIMRSTGKEYGLEVNNNVDERSNLILSTNVACKYLLKAKKRFGSWTLAAASYNAGIHKINSELERQSVDNYYDLLLSEETSRYVYRILAIKEIFNNPTSYGFNFKKEDLYNYSKTYFVEVDTAVTDFVQFASEFNINYKQLKIYNPWLMERHLNNKSRKKYKIKIPEIE